MVRASMNETDYVISFSDTGIGISEEDQAKLFERFARINRSGTRPLGSTGLGLAITKALVELHNGTVTAVSSPGEGSTFTVTIPREMPQESAA